MKKTSKNSYFKVQEFRVEQTSELRFNKSELEV